MVHPVPALRSDPLIIGGGPAGSAAAITLGRAGCRPVLLERTSGPTDKVCGDFLSADAIQQIEALGVDPLALGAMPIRRMRLIGAERVVETALPFPALGLSRRALDAALLRQACAVGVVVRTGQNVRQLAHEVMIDDARPSDRLDAPQRLWKARTQADMAFAADAVFLATGKHDLRDLPRRRGQGAVGMKMYFALSPEAASSLDGAIELTMFAGGYAGMQLVENGAAVLCIAIRRRAFQRHGGWAGLIEAIGRGSRRFAGLLADARPLLERPLAVAGIPYGYQARDTAADGLFRVGDQAAVIPSLTGDGMAIALHSGKAAAETWLAGGDSAAFHRRMSRTLAPQMRLAGVLHQLCTRATVQTAVIRAAGLFPGLLRQAAWRTRLARD